MTQEKTELVKNYQLAIYNNFNLNINLAEFYTIVGFILERRELESEIETQKTRKKKSRNG